MDVGQSNYERDQNIGSGQKVKQSEPKVSNAANRKISGAYGTKTSPTVAKIAK